MFAPTPGGVACPQPGNRPAIRDDGDLPGHAVLAGCVYQLQFVVYGTLPAVQRWCHEIGQVEGCRQGGKQVQLPLPKRVLRKCDPGLLTDVADVDVSIDGGATWQNVLRQTSNVRGPIEELLPIPLDRR